MNERDLYTGGLSTVLQEIAMAISGKENKIERMRADISDIRALETLLSNSEEARVALTLFMGWRSRGL